MTEDQLEQETLAWLAELGDILLPGLMSERLRLPEAVAVMDAVQ